MLEQGQILYNQINKELIECEFLIKQKKKLEEELKLVEADHKSALLLRETLSRTLESTKMSILDTLSNLISNFLQIVFPSSNFTFYLHQVTKRNKPGLEIELRKNGETFNLLDDTGDGVIDIIAFAIRVGVWSVSLNKTDPVFILDEPFGHVQDDRLDTIMEFVGNISRRFGIQFIIITHNQKIKDRADQFFKL